MDYDGEFPTIIAGAGIGAAIGGVGSIISDLAKGKSVDWKKAGKNALKGAAAGAIIGTGVGAVSALSAAGASSVAVNTAVAATVGASFRAGSDIVTSIKNKEMTISNPVRYVTSAFSGAVIYNSNRVSPKATKLGLLTQGVADLIAWSPSSLESYATAGTTSALTIQLARNSTMNQFVITALGTAALQVMEHLSKTTTYTKEDFIKGIGESVEKAILAKILAYLLPNKWIQEDEFTAIIDGVIRREQEACNE